MSNTVVDEQVVSISDVQYHENKDEALTGFIAEEGLSEDSSQDHSQAYRVPDHGSAEFELGEALRTMTIARRMAKLRWIQRQLLVSRAGCISMVSFCTK